MHLGYNLHTKNSDTGNYFSWDMNKDKNLNPVCHSPTPSPHCERMRKNSTSVELQCHKLGIRDENIHLLLGFVNKGGQ